VIDEDATVTAEAATGYYFNPNATTSWDFTYVDQS
jgi:hypothetical protein